MSDLTATSTSNTITLTWTEPDPIPSNGYSATHRCRRLCEESFNDFMQKLSSSSPLVFSGINPGSTCTISLFNGIFGTESIDFDSGNDVTTLSAGELKNDIFNWNWPMNKEWICGIRLNNLCGCSFKF